MASFVRVFVLLLLGGMGKAVGLLAANPMMKRQNVRANFIFNGFRSSSITQMPLATFFSLLNKIKVQSTLAIVNSPKLAIAIFRVFVLANR